MGRFRRFFEEAWSELKKVTWPSRQAVMTLTVLVLAISAGVGFYIAAWDYVFTVVLQFFKLA